MKVRYRRLMILVRALEVIEWRQSRGTAGGLEYLIIRIYDAMDRS